MKTIKEPKARSTVRDIMSTPVVTVAPDTAVKMIAELLSDHRISAVPVVDQAGRPVGIVSEGDILLKEMATPTGAFFPWFETPRDRAVRRRHEALVAMDLMTTPVITIHPFTTLPQAAKVMHEKRIKRLPVVEDGKIIGVISRGDLIRTYLVPDAELRRRVERALASWFGREAAAVKVSVQDGVVRLSGETHEHSQAKLISRLVSGFDGVLAVQSSLHWRIEDELLPIARS